MRTSLLGVLTLFVGALLLAQSGQDWMHYVRITGNGLGSETAVDRIMASVAESHVFGIEVDNDLTGHYESFLDPTAKLKALTAMAKKAHEAGNYAFVYTAGTECITGGAASKQHTLFKDHPDWMQRKITGEPALFTGGAAFWLHEGDEDVWVTPYAPEWRKLYMERIRQIAATGIDGIYVDIPYWMTHFTGWEDSWASFDDYTVAEFRRRTGLDAKKDVKIGDYRDAGFRKWVDFRIQTFTDFMKEVDENAKKVNPKCKTIAEIYPGLDEAAVRVGTDVYQLYGVVDTVAHEFSIGGKSADRNPLDWFGNMVGMYSFRAFAGQKPSWMLTYSWENEEKIKPAEAMKNLFMAQLMAGTNVWDARGHVMSGSNDLEARKPIYQWIKDHEKTFYMPRQPIHPVGIYFSPATRNYFPKDFTVSYRGMLTLLMQSHLEFQIVTPRTLDTFAGEVLILPDVRSLDQRETAALKHFFDSGKTLVVTGNTGAYGGSGEEVASNPIFGLLGVTDPKTKKSSSGRRKFLFDPSDPGKAYSEELAKSFNDSGSGFETLRAGFVKELTQVSQLKAPVSVEASPYVSAQVARVDGKIHIFLTNFKGLKRRENAVQTPEQNVRILFQSASPARMHVLPYLGEPMEVPCSREKGVSVCTIPEITKGAVAWID